MQANGAIAAGAPLWFMAVGIMLFIGLTLRSGQRHKRPALYWGMMAGLAAVAVVMLWLGWYLATHFPVMSPLVGEGLLCGHTVMSAFDPKRTLPTDEAARTMLRMRDLSQLERAVLFVIAKQASDATPALLDQISRARVTKRDNTWAGFYTTLTVSGGALCQGVQSPLGPVGANVAGLQHGMGFLLWLKDGRLDQLEGFSFSEETRHIDFLGVTFDSVGPRGTDA